MKIIDQVMDDSPRNMIPVPEEKAGLLGPVRVRKSNVPVENEEDNHKILSVIQRGYVLNGKQVRPAKVKVGEWKKSS